MNAATRAKFDVEKAVAWFKTMENFPYGYHNFIYGWIDTPKDNYPTLIDADVAILLFSFLEKIITKGIESLVAEGFN